MIEDDKTIYRLKWSLEETLKTIRDTTIYLHDSRKEVMLMVLIYTEYF